MSILTLENISKSCCYAVMAYLRCCMLIVVALSRTNAHAQNENQLIAGHLLFSYSGINKVSND